MRRAGSFGGVSCVHCRVEGVKGSSRAEAFASSARLELSSIVDRLIGEGAQIKLRQIKAHHRLGHEEPNHLLNRVDPIMGLRRARPTKLADRAWGSGLRHVERHPRPKTKAIAGQRQ